MADDKDRTERAARSRPARIHIEALLDEALVQTFPASDPIAIAFDEPDADKRHGKTRKSNAEEIDS